MNSDDLIEALYQQGLEPRAYSGRAMFGRYCVGVAVNDLGRYEYPRGWQHDSLGTGYIVYWPDAAWPEHLAIDNDEDE